MIVLELRFFLRALEDVVGCDAPPHVWSKRSGTPQGVTAFFLSLQNSKPENPTG